MSGNFSVWLVTVRARGRGGSLHVGRGWGRSLYHPTYREGRQDNAVERNRIMRGEAFLGRGEGKIDR
jgi:hypothetical protein